MLGTSINNSLHLAVSIIKHPTQNKNYTIQCKLTCHNMTSARLNIKRHELDQNKKCKAYQTAFKLH